MPKAIHPDFVACTIICESCNAIIKTKSTVAKFQTEICSKCHPFYTGQQTLVDTAGQVDRFRKRIKIAEEIQKDAPVKEAKQPKAQEEQKELSNEDLLKQVKQQLNKEAKAKEAKKEAKKTSPKAL